MRITAVSYLNTLPFIYGIEQQAAVSSRSAARSAVGTGGGRLFAGEDIVLSLRVPALCAADAIAGDTDIALVPAAVIPQIPGFSAETSFSSSFTSADRFSAEAFIPRIITNYCIGAEGAVDTVVLLSDTPVEKLRRVYLDAHSRTSVELARVLAREYWRIDPEWATTASGAGNVAPLLAEGGRLGDGEGVLAIGDKVFALREAYTYAYCYDLAQEWQWFTGGLPFVFAAWVACTERGASFAQRLDEALAYGVEHIAESITGTVNRSCDFDFDKAYRYLTRSIRFRLDDAKRKAMRLFWEKIIAPG